MFHGANLGDINATISSELLRIALQIGLLRSEQIRDIRNQLNGANLQKKGATEIAILVSLSWTILFMGSCKMSSASRHLLFFRTPLKKEKTVSLTEFL